MKNITSKVVTSLNRVTERDDSGRKSEAKVRYLTLHSIRKAKRERIRTESSPSPRWCAFESHFEEEETCNLQGTEARSLVSLLQRTRADEAGRLLVVGRMLCRLAEAETRRLKYKNFPGTAFVSEHIVQVEGRDVD